MDNTANLLWGLLFSSIGMGYFVYGRKQQHKVALYSGLALMIYPYFVANNLALIGIGVLLLALPKFIVL